MHRFIALLMIMAVARSQSALDDDNEVSPASKKWCKAVGASPEPDIVIYNQVPKTGSTTLTTAGLRHTSALRRQGGLRNHLFNNRFYRHHVSTDGSPSQAFENAMREYMSMAPHNNTRLFFAGHFYQYIFQQDTLRNKTVEAFSSIRNCHKRTLSNMQWVGYNQFPRGVNRTLCMHDMACLEKSGFTKSLASGYQANFLCSGKCLTDHNGDVYTGAMENIDELDYIQGGFSVVGTTERVQDTVHVLHCLYPSLYAREEVKTLNVQKANTDAVAAMQVLDAYVDKHLCNARDEAVYAKADRVLSEKVYLVNNYRDVCCRKPRPFVQDR